MLTALWLAPPPPLTPPDIRDLVQLEDVMEDEELKLGPNGGLIFCFE
jgi:hypothetical protein